MKSKNKTPYTLSKRGREIASLILLVLALASFLSLVSYHPLDPSINSFTTQPEKIENLLGIVGSYLADILLQFLGLGAFLLPLFLIFFGLSVVRKETKPWRYNRAIGSLAMVLCISAFSHLLDNSFSFMSKLPYQVPAGGLIGKGFADLFRRYLNLPGAYLLVFLFLVVSIMVTTNVSLFDFLAFLKRAFIFSLDQAKTLRDKLSEKIAVFREKRKSRDSAVKEKEKQLSAKLEKIKKSPPPHIVETVKPAPEKKPKPPPKQEEFSFAKKKSYTLPSADLLDPPPKEKRGVDRESLIMQSKLLEKKLLDFNVEGKVVEVRPGPVVTMFEFEPASGVKVSKILNLSDDLSLALRATSIRIAAPVPGKAVVGIEIPNNLRETVLFQELITSDEYRKSENKLPLALGRDIAGNPLIIDLAKMPHLLVAGATGSGKSVAVNAMICSVLFKAHPSQVRLILVDPKMLELSDYEGIPHLLLPVVTNPKDATRALRWAVREMENRYQLMSDKGVRNIEAFNRRIAKELKEKDSQVIRLRNGEGPSEEQASPPPKPPEKLPYLMVIIDELADLMMVASREVEECLTRLAQMARAAGIHLLLATQRPSVDVLTGVVKANFPARIAFQVSSKVDSRTIIDTNGAERLLGKGDMLLMSPGTSKLARIHGSFISDGEIKRTVEHIKQYGEPSYDPTILKTYEEAPTEDEEESDEMYDKAIALVADQRKVSVSMLQRRLRVGYNRAARMIERMEEEGIVGPADGSKPRDVLIGKI